ncbi:MAG: T9SS type A sorting domain-containing protein [Fibrobacteria bacterium]|nr:T9SS type A sorting domain-containing protein [Fibrobacteria bacterium]
MKLKQSFIVVMVLVQVITLSSLQAALPSKGMISMKIQVLQNVSSKMPSSDSSFTFEEFIGAGMNSITFWSGTFGKGRHDYVQPELVHEAHEHGLWVIGETGGNSASAINEAKILGLMGVDALKMIEPYNDWPGADFCTAWDKAFNETEYKKIQAAAKLASPRGECPVLISDYKCSSKFAGWSSVDGLISKVFTDEQYSKYYPQAVNYKTAHANQWNGMSVWIGQGSIDTTYSRQVNSWESMDGPWLPDDRFVTWFTNSYNTFRNTELFAFNKRSSGMGWVFGTNWTERVKTIKAVAKRNDPVPTWQNFSPGEAVKTSAPDVSVQVRQNWDGGLAPGTVECYYAIDTTIHNNTKWIKHENVSAIGTDGTKEWVTITAKRVPFNHVGSKYNKVMFKITDKYPYLYHRNARTWSKHFTVKIDTLDWTDLSNDGVVTSVPADMSVTIQSAAGIDVASVVCEYSTDGGASWKSHDAACSGEGNSTAKETVTVKAVPFSSDKAGMNKIRFSILAGSDTLKSAEYPVKVMMAPVFADMKPVRSGSNLDVTLNVQDESGLAIGSQEVPAREESVLLLHLDGDAKDASGNGYDGTLRGNPQFVDHASWKTGAGQEKMLYLDGEGDYVDVGFHYLGRSKAFTVSTWVKAENNGPAITFGSNESAETVIMSFGTGNVGFIAWNSSRKQYKLSTAAGSFSYNEWHHVAFVFDGADAKCYVDGKLQGTADWSGFNLWKMRPLRLGNNTNRWSFYKGYMDEVHVISRALSDVEIANDHNSGLYRYTNDGGTTWSAWKTPTFDKANGVKETVKASMASVALAQNTDSLNRIQVAARDANGNTGSREFILLGNDAVPVENQIVQIGNISFYPNPFRNHTNLSFSISGSQMVKLAIYNVNGEMVKSYASKSYPAGKYSIAWDGKGSNGKELNAGQYYVKIRIGSNVAVRKVLMLK